MQRIIANLKLIRRERWNMSQEKFAQLMQSTRSKINSYENGTAKPGTKFLIQLRKYSGISVTDICESELKLEDVAKIPLSKENRKVTPIIYENQPNYDLALNDLNSYHNRMSNRIKTLEERVKTLEHSAPEENKE